MQEITLSPDKLPSSHEECLNKSSAYKQQTHSEIFDNERSSISQPHVVTLRAHEHVRNFQNKLKFQYIENFIISKIK